MTRREDGIFVVAIFIQIYQIVFEFHRAWNWLLAALRSLQQWGDFFFSKLYSDFYVLNIVKVIYSKKTTITWRILKILFDIT